MKNLYRVNITCPRCKFVGDVEQDFPCGHEAALALVEEMRDEARVDAATIERLASELLSAEEALGLAEEWLDIEQRACGKGVDSGLDLVLDKCRAAIAKSASRASEQEKGSRASNAATKTTPRNR